MSEAEEVGILEAYAAYIQDVNQNRATRTAIDNTFVTVISFFLAGDAYVASTFLLLPQAKNLSDPSFATWLPCLAVVAISIVGVRFCGLWHKISEDSRKAINFKFKNLENLERHSNVLWDAGLRLFVNEYEERHPEAVSKDGEPAPSPDKDASNAGALASKAGNRSKPKVRGVARGVRQLQMLFNDVFMVLLFGVPLTKGLAVVIPLLAMWAPQLPFLR